MAAAAGHLDDQPLLRVQEVDACDVTALSTMDDLRYRQGQARTAKQLEESPLEQAVSARREDQFVQPRDTATSGTLNCLGSLDDVFDGCQSQADRGIDRRLER